MVNLLLCGLLLTPAGAFQRPSTTASNSILRRDFFGAQTPESKSGALRVKDVSFVRSKTEEHFLHNAPKDTFSKLLMSSTETQTSSSNDTATVNSVDKRPYPKINDVVQYPGKWKDEIKIGQIKALQFIESRQSWIADIEPFEEIGNETYAKTKNIGRSLLYEPVSSLRPVRAYYVRSSNGWTVPFSKKNKNAQTGAPLPQYLANSYKLDDFKPPPPPKVDTNSPSYIAAVQDYEQTKNALFRDTTVAGAIGSMLALIYSLAVQGGTDAFDPSSFVSSGAILQGLGDVSNYAAGVGFSLLYLSLLSSATDQVRYGGKSLNEGLPGARLLAPVMLAVFLAVKSKLLGSGSVVSGVESAAGGVSTGLFNLVPRQDFLYAMFGFLTYRIPMIGRQGLVYLSDSSGSSGDDGGTSGADGSGSGNSAILTPKMGSVAFGIELARRAQKKGQQQQQQQQQPQVQKQLSRLTGGKGGVDVEDDFVSTAAEVVKPLPPSALVLVSGPQAAGKTAILAKAVAGANSGSSSSSSSKVAYVVPRWCRRRPSRDLVYDRSGVFDSSAGMAGSGLVLDLDGPTYDAYLREGRFLIDFEPRKQRPAQTQAQAQRQTQGNSVEGAVEEEEKKEEEAGRREIMLGSDLQGYEQSMLLQKQTETNKYASGSGAAGSGAGAADRVRYGILLEEIVNCVQKASAGSDSDTTTSTSSTTSTSTAIVVEVPSYAVPKAVRDIENAIEYFNKELQKAVAKAMADSGGSTSGSRKKDRAGAAAGVDFPLRVFSSLTLVDVWVSLSSFALFEQRLKQQQQQQQQQQRQQGGKNNDTSGSSGDGSTSTSLDLDRVLSEMEFGVTSGLFDFTILNTNLEQSVDELYKAVEYAIDNL